MYEKRALIYISPTASTLQERSGIFTQHRLRNMLAGSLGTKNLVGITGTGPMGARGATEGWGSVTDGGCVCLPVCSPSAALMLLESRRRGLCYQEGAKAVKNFPRSPRRL